MKFLKENNRDYTEKRTNIWNKLIDDCKLVLKDGFIDLDLLEIKNSYNFRKHLSSNNNGLWEGFELKVSNLGFYLTYVKKLEQSSQNLKIEYYSKEFNDVIIKQKEFIKIGELFY